MGGDIGFTSSPGHGSQFWFTIAVHRPERTTLPPPPPRPLPTESDHQALRGRRILVVEDNEFNQQIAAELLEAMGARVTVASNGQEALDKLALSRPFDAVLMDVQMPEMDGLETTRRIRMQSRLSRIPIIAMTANASPEDRSTCLSAGMDDFEAKPIEPERLYATLTRWLEDPTSVRRTLPATVDREVLARLLRNDPTKVERFSEHFVTTTATSVIEMQNALVHRNRAEIARVAHRVKSAAATVGAGKLASACAALERACALRADQEIVDGVKALADLLRQAANEMNVGAPNL
jgi:CheY-like chemotaxis protein/HPt (histidine-containing phosphotransfer) domain-containing protein